VHIVSNGSITVLSNFTREYSYYVFETILAHRADADKALALLEQTGAEIAAEPAFPHFGADRGHGVSTSSAIAGNHPCSNQDSAFPAVPGRPRTEPQDQTAFRRPRAFCFPPP